MQIKVEQEKVIERKLDRSIRVVGGWTLKLLPTFVSGLPDRLIIMKGKTYFVELKTTGKRPRPDQVVVHKRLEKLGFTVVVIDSSAGIQEFVKRITL